VEVAVAGVGHYFEADLEACGHGFQFGDKVHQA